jgi:thioredoxin-related protein
MKNTGLFIVSLVAVVSFAVPAHALTWHTNYPTAAAEAKASNRPLLLFFGGSDWCGWTKKLNDEVWIQPAFLAFAESNFVCVSVDFPRKTPQDKATQKQNRDLAARFRVKGYPVVILLRPDGGTIGQTGYKEGGPELYVQFLQGLLAQAEKTRRDAIELARVRMDYVGEWRNAEPEADGITRLKVYENDDVLTVRAWIASGDGEKDLGVVPLDMHYETIGGRGFHYGLSMRDIGYATECLKVEATADGAVVDAFTIYKDRSGRADRHRLYLFRLTTPPPAS